MDDFPDVRDDDNAPLKKKMADRMFQSAKNLNLRLLTYFAS